MELIDVPVALEREMRCRLHALVFPSSRLDPWPAEHVAVLLASWDVGQPVDLGELGRWALRPVFVDGQPSPTTATAMQVDGSRQLLVHRAVVDEEPARILKAVRGWVLDDWGIAPGQQVHLGSRDDSDEPIETAIQLLAVEATPEVEVTYQQATMTGRCRLAQLVERMADAPEPLRPRHHLPFVCHWPADEVEAFIRGLVDAEIVDRMTGEHAGEPQVRDVAWALARNWLSIQWLAPDPGFVDANQRWWAITEVVGLNEHAPRESTPELSLRLDGDQQVTLHGPTPWGHKLSHFRRQLVPTVLSQRWGLTAGAWIHLVGRRAPVEVRRVSSDHVVVAPTGEEESVLPLSEVLERLDPLPPELYERFSDLEQAVRAELRVGDAVAFRGAPSARFVVQRIEGTGAVRLHGSAHPVDGRGWDITLEPWQVRQRRLTAVVG